MSALQLDFFQSEEESELSMLRKEVSSCKSSLDKVRRSLFAKTGEHSLILLEMDSRLNIIEKNKIIVIVLKTGKENKNGLG